MNRRLAFDSAFCAMTVPAGAQTNDSPANTSFS
jgi:hypothetical protein